MSEIADLGFEVQDVVPGEGWHCSHFFYSFDRPAIATLRGELPSVFQAAKEEFVAVLSGDDHHPARFQLGMTSGHKADFSLMLMDPDPIKVEAMQIKRFFRNVAGDMADFDSPFDALALLAEVLKSDEDFLSLEVR